MHRVPPPLNHMPLSRYRHRPISSLVVLVLLAGISLLALSACGKESTAEYRHTILAFGTLIEITLYDTTEPSANAAFDQLERDFHQYHASWTPWEASDLSRINDSIRAGTEVSVADSILPMITASKELFEKSNGLFNPAIGNLINLWQMHLHDDPDIRPPDAAEITRVLNQQPRMSDIQIAGSVLRSSNRNVQLSLGAFAKGYAIDLALDYLRSRGIDHAVINAGGDLRVAGRHGERPWRIGIRHPRQDGVIAWLDANADESIFTSGDYERFYLHDGKRYHHILDPRTGYPASGTSSVTVIHDNAGTADAAATALFVAGPEHWHEIASSMGIRYVMLIDTDGRIHMNPAMKERVNLINPESVHIVLSQPL
jgi:thiamine biosynthesis lipoprotein